MLFDTFHGLLPCHFFDLFQFIAGQWHIEIHSRNHVDDIHQMSLPNYVAAGENYGPVNDIFQFAHITGPVIVH